VGLMNMLAPCLAPWRRWRIDPAANSAFGNGPHGAKTELWRICRFEQVEERCPLAADIQLGAVYEDPASGTKAIPNTFTISWSGGAPGTELKQLMISTDPNGNPTVQVGDPFFDTAPGAPGVYSYAPLNIISHDGFTVTGQNPAMGSTQLVLNFSGFTAGKQLVLTIDVEDLDGRGVNATVNGHEFEGSQLIGTFSAPHYQDDTLNGTFQEFFQSAHDASGLALPGKDYIGGLIGGKTVNTVPTPVYTAGAFAANQQTPLPITLQGTVYYDADLDNVQQSGEPGIQNVKLTLLENDGTAYVATGVTATTDANGNYKFTNVLPGDYEIVETQPSGYFAVGSSAGNVHGVTYGQATDAHTLGKIVVLGGEDVVQNDFSQSLPNSIAGTVRTAPIGTGDPSDAPKGGVQVVLYQNGNQVASTTTASDGTYSFTGLPPGKYTVKEVVPTGYYAINDVVGSDGGTAVDLTTLGNIVLTSDEKGVRYDFYIQQPVTVAGTVRVSPMGTHDANSTPLVGVTVQLLDSEGNLLETTTTASDGTYRFPTSGSLVLKPGTYTVHELLPGGYYATYDAVGSQGGTAVDLTTLGNITLTSGESGVQYDFWLQQPVTVAGIVRVSPMGTHDANSTPISGVTVQLLDSTGNLLETTTTASDGSYAFPVSGPLLKPGSYSVRETVHVGYYATYDAVGSQGGTAVDLTTLGNITLTSGESGVQYDFWLQQPVTVAGIVRVSPMGTHDANSTPISGVTVQLLDAKGNLLETTTTAADGTYAFPTAGLLLRPGTYTVHELIPSGYYATYDSVGNDGGNATDLRTLSNITLSTGQNGVQYDFWLQQPVSISGYVHVDVHGNCETDPNAPPLAGVSIQLLDTQGNVLATTTTDDHGFYLFNQLPPGMYAVREIVPPGDFADDDHVGSAGGTLNGLTKISGASLTSDMAGTHYDFCVLQPVSISGYVHVNVNGNCDTDPNAPPLAGVTIDLLDAQGNVIGATTTDAKGYYIFQGLRPGVYGTREVVPSGYYADDNHVGSAGGSLNGLTEVDGATLTSGMQGTHYDYCLDLPVSISGYVRVDVHGNCETDPNAPPLAGVNIQLLDAHGNVLATTTTDDHGYYIFNHLPPGVYGVNEIVPPGDFADDDHVGSAGGSLNGLTQISGASLTSGMAGTHYDFCVLQPVSISGYVHVNVNGNCDTDPNAPPLAGVTIDLLDAQGNVMGTTTTDANGFYIFQGLRPGVYGTREVVPTGYFADDNHVGSAGGSLNGLTEIDGATLMSAMNGTHYDYCLNQPVSISGYVHVDVNGNCETDPNAPPLSGVTIQLLDAQGNVLATTATDANGYYVFDHLPPAVYGVREIVPAGDAADDDHVGSAGGSLNGLTEINGATLASGMAGTHYDFCVLLPASISGYVHVDVNGNCESNPNAPPLAGVTIDLLDAQGNVIGTTTTDANGYYVFNHLLPGAYGVSEIVPAGYYADDDHVGNAGGTLNGLTQINGAGLTSGLVGTHYDFCVAPPVGITGYVKLDVYGDCETTPADPPLAGVVIHLLDANGNVIGTTQTDAAGQYVFGDLPPGTYGVEEIIPSGYFYSDQHIGSAGGVIAGQGVTDSISLAHGQIGLAYDFCLTPPSTISGYVFIDGPPIETTNPATDLPSVLASLPSIRTGIRQPGDTPVPGVTLMLADATGTPLLNQSGNPIETTTDINGYYQFAGLPPGLYSVIKVHPSGYIDGLNKAGTLGGEAISPTLIQVGAESIGPSISAALLETVGPVNDAIVRIPLGNGLGSLNNNFSEIILTQAIPPIPIPTPTATPLTALPLTAFAPPPAPPAAPVASPPGSPFLSGSWGVSGLTWHLSVVDAGLPRSSLAMLRSAAQLAAMRADVAAWFGARMRHGTWKLHPGAKGEARQVVFGKLGGKPVSGDFNGDGVTDVGVYVDGEWFIDLNGNGIWDDDDLWAKLGTAHDKPVTGDWDGDGKTDIGIFGPAWPGDPRAVQAEPGLPDPHNRPTGTYKNMPPAAHEATLGRRQMKRTRDGSLRADLIDHVFHFGQAGDVPITGDWTGVGIDSIGIYNNGQWILDVDGDGKRSEKDITLRLGEAGDKPVVGDFDGDGVDELGIYRDGHWHIDMNHDGVLDEHDQHLELGDASHNPIVGDWDGDGVDQIGVHQEHVEARDDI